MLKLGEFFGGNLRRGESEKEWDASVYEEARKSDECSLMVIPVTYLLDLHG